MIKDIRQVYSIIISFLVYTYFINWRFAMTFVVGISLHEMGHLIMANKLGYTTRGYFLIPFIGGMSDVEETFKSYKDMALIAIMGPLLGSITALCVAVLGYSFNNQSMLSASIIMTIWNLFNLLPFAMLDGSKILEALIMSFNKTFGVYIIFILHAVCLSFALYYLGFFIWFLCTAISFLYLSRLQKESLYEIACTKLNVIQCYYIIALLLILFGIMLITLRISIDYSIPFITQINYLTK